MLWHRRNKWLYLGVLLMLVVRRLLDTIDCILLATIRICARSVLVSVFIGACPYTLRHAVNGCCDPCLLAHAPLPVAVTSCAPWSRETMCKYVGNIWDEQRR